MGRYIRLVSLISLVLLPTVTGFSQQSFGRVDIRALRSSNTVTFKTADTNVTIGYAAWRNENPRATIVAQKQVTTNWSDVSFQFSVSQSDQITLILRGRYRETEPTGELVPDWVWVDNVSVVNGTDRLSQNGSFEKVHGFIGRRERDGQPEKWGYKGKNREIKFDASSKFPQDGQRCLKVWHSLAAHQSFRVESNVWYTVHAYFRAD